VIEAVHHFDGTVKRGKGPMAGTTKRDITNGKKNTICCWTMREYLEKNVILLAEAEAKRLGSSDQREKGIQSAEPDYLRGKVICSPCFRGEKAKREKLGEKKGLLLTQGREKKKKLGGVGRSLTNAGT